MSKYYRLLNSSEWGEHCHLLRFVRDAPGFGYSTNLMIFNNACVVCATWTNEEAITRGYVQFNPENVEFLFDCDDP